METVIINRLTWGGFHKYVNFFGAIVSTETMGALYEQVQGGRDYTKAKYESAPYKQMNMGTIDIYEIYGSVVYEQVISVILELKMVYSKMSVRCSLVPDEAFKPRLLPAG